MNRLDRLFWSRPWALTRPYWVSDRRLRAQVAVARLLFNRPA
jgi:hypothetical protein